MIDYFRSRADRSEKPFRRTCDPSVHRKYACQTGKRNHRHTCFNGGKSHLRNNKPLLLSLSTNDALGMNMKNIGLLLNTKNIYFVPFGQDDPEKKPNSMTAHTDLLIPALEAALENRQLQPVIRDIVKK